MRGIGDADGMSGADRIPRMHVKPREPAFRGICDSG